MTFIAWLQSRLNAHRADPPLAIDGVWGRLSIRALRDFQHRRGLPISGVADTATVNALRALPPAPAGDSGPAVPDPMPANAAMPPWMAELHRMIGLHERRNNATLNDYMRKWGRWLGDVAKLPWCGDMIESAVAKTLPDEPLPTSPFWAQSWKNFGRDVADPIVGSIGVIRWNSRSGHVGVVAGVDGGRVNLLGGNQSDAITIASFPRSKFIAFRWPSTFPVQRYPALRGIAITSGSLSATR